MTSMPNLTVIELSPEDAAAFVLFQKRYAFIQLMESLGVFDIRSGSVEIHFDALGKIGSVDKHQHFRT